MNQVNLQHLWSFTFGVLGNLLSLAVYLAPVPTFCRIYRKKSTEGFQSVPYIVALFSSMLWIYYAVIKTNTHLLISINSLGCFIETAYLAMFVLYAPKKGKIITATVFTLTNVIGFGLIILFTGLFAKGTNRVRVVGWICVGISVAVFAAPLSIIRLVLRTKSVEFMPFLLSFLLTASAGAWLLHGIFQKDIYIAIPNILGIVLGMSQMVLYMCYRNGKDQREYRQSVLVITSRGHGEIHPIEQKSDGNQTIECS